VADPRIAGLNGYTLLREVGRGGMAIVYLAEQQSLGREVALKVMSPGSEQDPALAERFLREARIAASLQHPHIVAIHDFGVHDGSLFIAMQYEPGGSVLPVRGECVEPRAALRIVRDIASALEYAHGRGVVHRDIKPDNILRRADGAATLSDFGIARMMHGESVLTTEGTSVGTPQYMSPEQLRGEKVDGRSDIYSLGVVLWQLLTGELPYSGGDGWAIGTQHISADIPRLPSGRAHLQPLIDAMLAKNAAARPQSGGEVVQLVDALLSGANTPPEATTGGNANTPATVSAAPSLSGRRRNDERNRRWGLGGGLAMLALVLAVIAWRHYGSANPAPAAGSVDTPAAMAPAASQPVMSIAVLAFEDLSEAHDQAYFSDGISEELLIRLAQVPGLQVAGRTSSLSFKGKQATLAEIGKALDVASVLEGSVRKDGDRLRITVQLSNAADGFQLWSQSYDRKLVDVFAVQEEIASAVVESLKIELLAGTPVRAGARHVPRFEVYDNFLRGRQALTRNSLEDFRLALSSFRSAVELDPNYADAWSGLAMAESFVGEAGQSDAGQKMQARARAMAAAERAVALDPGLGDAHAARGYLLSHNEWKWSAALADLGKAVSLDPRDGRNQLRHGYLLGTLNRLPEARAALEQATVVDPMFTPGWYWLGRVRAGQGDFEGARQAMSRALAIDPQFQDAEAYLGLIALLQGDAAVARATFSRLGRAFSVSMADYSLGRPAQARQELQALIDAPGQDNFYAIAMAHAWMGDKDQAFAWLDRCVQSRDAGLAVLAYDPVMRSLRDDPRYRPLLGKIGLP
jgi:TolB-like protein/Tfp pilus assembly protein PilF/tRNA A-37 threonylcarbamoyl transferase component Bud32